MPYYDHDKDYPFAAFITNLGKYNEGELVGEWVKFPTTAEELKEVFKRIGIGQKDDFGQPYEEWFITDYDCYVDGLYSKLGEYENLDELNYLASKLDEMSESEYAQFQAGMEMGDHCGSLQEIINLTENLDCYEVYPDIHDYDDLGRYYIEELDVMQVPEHLQNYIDYEAYGRDVALEENGTFTDQGYVRDTGDSFHEYYDGERGSIPDEYRVMTFQDDLPEEEKSEWAMDIAFDMDEFFRQNDPQYAAEHPEAHAAKEEIYESLMAGRISALDEKLAALGQTQEDYLPSEIEKFKDATGYEEFLDFDPAEVKAALEDPEKSHADEMLSAAERAASEKMTVLVVEPMKKPYVKEIDPDLHSLQAEVGGDIGATYPYSDPVALVCNDEGKLIGLDLNRGLRDENGEIYDIVAGTFLVVGLGEEDFASLSPELIQKYTEQFKTKDLINLGLFTVLYFVIGCCVAIPIGFVPIFLPVLGSLWSLITGIPFMLFLTRVKKFGMVTIMGVLSGLLMGLTGMGFWGVPMGLIFGLLGDLILKSGDYKSAKKSILGYAVFSLWMVGTYIPMYFMVEDSWASFAASFGEEYADRVMAVMPMWSIILVVAGIFVFAILGGLLGKALLKKHFAKAGIA